jgi:F1F0 ATPase subunit 2
MLVGVAMDARAMTWLYVTEHGLFILILKSGAWLAIGGVIGASHYMTLRWNVQMLATGSSAAAAVAVQLIRLAIMAGVLAIITRHYGAPPLLVTALGILASRAAVLRLGAVS